VLAALQDAFRLGEATDAAGRAKAVDLYASITRQNPACHVAWYNLGVVQARNGLWTEALESFSKAGESADLRVVAACARLRLMVEHGRKLTDRDFPEDFRGENRAALGVHGPCHNAANELRNRGYTCSAEGKGSSCTIKCIAGEVEYAISVNDFLGMLLKNV